MLVLYLRQYLR